MQDQNQAPRSSQAAQDGFRKAGGYSRQPAQLLHGRFPDFFHALEVTQQLFFSPGTYPRDEIEGRLQGLFLPAVSVEINGKPVRLVADVLKKQQ